MPFFGREKTTGGAVALGQVRNAQRDFAIFRAAAEGRSPERLALEHGLSLHRIQGILLAERNKLAVSLDPLYQALRKAQLD